MNILIVSATKLEINNLLAKINCNEQSSIKFGTHTIDTLIVGVGLVFITYKLSKILASKHYDLIINVGIAGSFNKSLKIGQVVNVKTEEFADIGAERPEGFKTIFELGFANNNDFPFESGKLTNNSFTNSCLDGIVDVSAISTNTAHTKEESINCVANKYRADIETMEGAAFFYVCINEKVKFLQIRAISNYVEANNENGWYIPLAVSNLTDFIISFMKSNR